MGKQSSALIPVERIEGAILLIRGQKVMLAADLAALYGVSTSNLNKAVSRNRERFPDDFMFQLTPEETERLRFQSGTSKGRGGRRYRPYAFTEQGVAMLSSVLIRPNCVAWLGRDFISHECIRRMMHEERNCPMSARIGHPLSQPTGGGKPEKITSGSRSSFFTRESDN